MYIRIKRVLEELCSSFQGSYSAIVIAGGMGGHNGPLSSVEVLPLSKSLTSKGYFFNAYILFFFKIQVILYFKVYLMTCPTSPIILLPALVL